MMVQGISPVLIWAINVAYDMRVYCGKLTVFFFPALILMGCAISPGADPAGMYPLDDFPESFCPESSIEKLHRPDPGRMVPLDDFEEYFGS